MLCLKSILSLQEAIALDQCIERFNLEIWQNGTYKEVLQGTTAGYKRLMTFPAVQAQGLVINILQCRLNPQIEDLELYLNEGSI